MTDVLPDELVALLFTTPACIFVCKRLSAVLLAHHAVGLLDYYLVTDGGGAVKLAGEPRLGDVYPPRRQIITYGPPRHGAANTVAEIDTSVAATVVRRLMPRSRGTVIARFYPRKSGTVSSVIKDCTLCTVRTSDCMAGIAGVVPWNTRTWPLVMWYASMQHMQNIVTRKMYHKMFFGAG